MRERLRERNLYDTGQPTDLPVPATNGDGERRYSPRARSTGRSPTSTTR